MSHDHKEKWEKIELRNQESIRIFGDKKNYNSLGICKEGTRKQTDMKEKKLEKSTLKEQDIF